MTITWRRETAYATSKREDEREEKPQMKPTSEILERIYNNSTKHENGVYTRLYRYLLREDIYYSAYKNLYANQGAGTKGTDNDTADGFGDEYIKKLINELENMSYKPKPVRRTYIPKKGKGTKKRPLGVPSFRDKLLQDVIKQFLQAIYEPIFSDRSHGFRPNRSCHTALKQICKGFNGVKWFVEGDIKGCFDNIDHEILLSILSKKIKDSRFINLIRSFLKAGYIEDWKYNNTYSGTPQGGILSPILANIYLNELDKKVDAIKSEFDSPAKRKRTKEYSDMLWNIERVRRLLKRTCDDITKKNLIEEMKIYKKELKRIPCKDTTDKKMVYVRYADDFLIGINGTKEDSVKIKAVLKEYLAENLNLEMSEEKTKITHSANNARFLSYDISVRRTDKLKRRKDGIVQRTLNNTVSLSIPFQEKVTGFIIEKGIGAFDNKGNLQPTHRNAILINTDLEIIETYNSQTRGICNYFKLAGNFYKLSYFTYIMEYSCLKTLAHKHQMSMSKVKDKFRLGKTWAIPYETKTGKKNMPILLFKNIKKKNGFDGEIDVIKSKFYGFNQLEKRLKANKCELCGVENSIYEIHHVNKLKNLKGKQTWEKAMIARKRKTLVVCKECHYKIHGKQLRKNNS